MLGKYVRFIFIYDYDFLILGRSQIRPNYFFNILMISEKPDATIQATMQFLQAMSEVPGGGVNVIAPNLQVHVHMATPVDEAQRSMASSNDETVQSDDNALIRLDLTKLSRFALSELSEQVCLPCKHNYTLDGGTRIRKVLSCGHKFCKECISKE